MTPWRGVGGGSGYQFPSMILSPDNSPRMHQPPEFTKAETTDVSLSFSTTFTMNPLHKGQVDLDCQVVAPLMLYHGEKDLCPVRKSAGID